MDILLIGAITFVLCLPNAAAGIAYLWAYMLDWAIGTHEEDNCAGALEGAWAGPTTTAGDPGDDTA